MSKRVIWRFTCSFCEAQYDEQYILMFSQEVPHASLQPQGWNRLVHEGIEYMICPLHIADVKIKDLQGGTRQLP